MPEPEAWVLGCELAMTCVVIVYREMVEMIKVLFEKSRPSKEGCQCERTEREQWSASMTSSGRRIQRDCLLYSEFEIMALADRHWYTRQTLASSLRQSENRSPPFL